MDLEIKVTVIPPPGTPPPPPGTPPPTTPGHEKCVEVGSKVTLTTEDGQGPFTWTESSNGTMLISVSDSRQRAWSVQGRAFGVTEITVEGKDKAQGRLKLYVGSVVIVGADGSHCQVFADGSAKRIAPDKVDSRVTVLVDANAPIADLTDTATKAGDPPSEAVTCYVLNLKSFALDKTNQNR